MGAATATITGAYLTALPLEELVQERYFIIRNDSAVSLTLSGGLLILIGLQFATLKLRRGKNLNDSLPDHLEKTKT